MTFWSLLPDARGTQTTHRLTCTQYLWKENILRYIKRWSVNAKDGRSLLTVALRYICWEDILGAMLESETPNRTVWESVVGVIERSTPTDVSLIRHGMSKCKECIDMDALDTLYRLAKTRRPERLTPRIASVLPDDLGLMTRWMSLCKRPDVARALASNAVSVQGDQCNQIRYFEQKLEEACNVRRGAGGMVSAWLDIYQAKLHECLSNLLEYRSNITLKLDMVESAEERTWRDELEKWLENSGLPGAGALLDNLRNDKHGSRRKDGYVWHAFLARRLAGSGAFGSVELEHEWKDRSETKKVDMRLSDDLGDDIHIEAWDGQTKQSYHVARRLILGKLDEENHFEDWPSANKKLAEKAEQLPDSGRNFVIADMPQGEPMWQSMAGVKFDDSLCVMQVAAGRGIISAWCRPDYRHVETVRRMSKSLNCYIILHPSRTNMEEQINYVYHQLHDLAYFESALLSKIWSFCMVYLIFLGQPSLASTGLGTQP